MRYCIFEWLYIIDPECQAKFLKSTAIVIIMETFFVFLKEQRLISLRIGNLQLAT